MSQQRASDTELLRGPFRNVMNPNADGGAGSIHDQETATKLGFRGGTVAGSNHMDLFPPLALEAFGQHWWECGSLSLYFRNATIDREPVSASLQRPARANDVQADCWVHREDGMLVAEGSIAVGDPGEPSALQRIPLEEIRPDGVRILEKVTPGMPIADLGVIYSSAKQEERLRVITEPHAWYEGDSPWGGPILTPCGMEHLLYSAPVASMRHLVGSSVGLFGAIELRNLNGPCLVDTPYTVGGKVLAVGQSPKTEFFWFETTATDTAGKPIASMRMLLRFMKASSDLWME